MTNNRWRSVYMQSTSCPRNPTVTDYWRSLKDEFGEQDEAEGLSQLEFDGDELAPRTAREWFRRRGYHWADLRKGVFKDGHERSDVVAYRNDVFLPTLAVLEPTFVR